MDISTGDIINIALQNLKYLSPALLVICGLLFAESMSDTLIRIVRQTRRYARV